MVYRDKTFCSESYECGTKTCQHWVDFDVDTDEAISLARFKADNCGWSPVNQIDFLEVGND
jgi:hypothetical protein